MSLCIEAGVIFIVRCAQKWRYTLIQMLNILEEALLKREGKTLSRGALDHLWPYLCMCQLCTNRNGSLFALCASVKPLTSHPPRLCLGPPGRLPFHLTGTWTYRALNSVEELYEHWMFHNLFFPFSLCPIFSIKEKHCWTTQMLKWFGVHPFDSRVFAGWCEGKTWQTTWHFWGQYGG